MLVLSFGTLMVAGLFVHLVIGERKVMVYTNDMSVPIIGQGVESKPVEIVTGTGEARPLVNFLKKEKPKKVDSSVLKGIVIPYVYYWEDVEGGKSLRMTMAFRILGRDFGMTYPIEDGATMKQIELLRGRLFAVVKDSLDSLVHHGEKVLDSFGQIDPRLVNDEEAIRFKYDKDWDKKVAAFNQLVRVKPITKVEANKLKLINA